MNFWRLCRLSFVLLSSGGVHNGDNSKAVRRKAYRVSRSSSGSSLPQRVILRPAGHPWRRRRPPVRHPPCHVHRLPHEEEGRGVLRTRRTQESSQCHLLFETSEQRVLRLNFL